MNILFCLGTMDKGGAQRVVAILSNYLVEKNNICIITDRNKEEAYKLSSQIHREHLDKNTASKNIFKRNFSRIRELHKIQRKYSPDIIISFLPEPTIRILISNLLNKRKIIISIRNDPKIEYSNFLKRILVNILFLRANGIVFQTTEAKDFFIKPIQKKSTLIENPIDNNFIKTPYRGIRNKEIVNVGRLVAQKNQKLLIDAFDIFYKVNTDYKLKIYGNGPLLQDLQNYANSKQSRNNIIFMGESDNIYKEIYKSSLFILTSDYEGMPNALLEALSLGIPCISTDCPCGGPRALIRNGKNGYLVPVGDAIKISDKMIKILLEQNSTIPKLKEVITLQEKHSQNNITKKWLKYIYEVIK